MLVDLESFSFETDPGIQLQDKTCHRKKVDVHHEQIFGVFKTRRSPVTHKKRCKTQYSNKSAVQLQVTCLLPTRERGGHLQV
jgi:hypothetical protein